MGRGAVRQTRWVEWCDLVATASLAAGLLVLLTGGVRFHVLGLRVSATSGGRFLLLAVTLIVVRHVLHRRPPLTHRIRAWGAALRQRTSPAVGAATAAWLATRLPMLLVGYLAVSMIGYPERVPWRVASHEMWNLPARWDAGWYLGIATNGYEWDPESRRQQNIAFFPGYPLLMRTGAVVLGASQPDPTDVERASRRTAMAGLAISLGAFWWALVYVYRLGRRWLEPDQARTTVLLMAAYPFAVFFGALYTEALFLLATVATVYHFERREWWRAATWGLVVGFTRPNGCFLSVPLGLIALGQVWRPGEPLVGRGSLVGCLRHEWRDLAIKLLPRLAVAAMPGIAMLLFSGYVYWLTGHPFRWVEVHAAWGRSYRGLDELVLGWYRYVSYYGFYEYAFTLPVDLLNASATVFTVALIWPVTRRFGLPYGLLLVLGVVPPLVAGGFLSMGRITSVLFPVFLYLGAVLGPSQRVGWIAGFALVQGLTAAVFYTWRPLF